VEILIGVVLLAVAASGSALLITTANRQLGSSESLGGAQAAIDSDLSRIRRLAEDYTCCPGSCTADAAEIQAAGVAGKCQGSVGDSAYYFPQQSAEITTFAGPPHASSLCGNGQLTANLITAIQAQGTLSGISRAVQEDDVTDLTDHRIRITYTGSGANAGISRVVKLVPTVAAWCP